jgi:hypothetical protein
VDSIAQGLKSKNKRWVVEWANSPNDPELLGVDPNSVFVGGLNPIKITKEILEAKFSECGAIESVHLVNNFDRTPGSLSDTGSPRESTSSASAATLSTATSSEVLTAEDQEPLSPVPTEPSRGLNEENLRLLDDEPPRNNAFAFVRFSEASSAVVAIEKFNDEVFLDRRLRVQYCETQEMKQKKKAVKYQNSSMNSVTSYMESHPVMYNAPATAAPFHAHPMRVAPMEQHIYPPLSAYQWVERAVVPLEPIPTAFLPTPTRSAYPLLPQSPAPLHGHPFVLRSDHGGWIFVPQVRFRQYTRRTYRVISKFLFLTI